MDSQSAIDVVTAHTVYYAQKTRKVTYENISYIIKRCTLWSRIFWRFLSTCDQSRRLLRRVAQTLVFYVCMYIWLFVFYLLCRVLFLWFMSLTIPLVYSASLILDTFYTLSNDSIVIQYWNSSYYYTSQQWNDTRCCVFHIHAWWNCITVPMWIIAQQVYCLKRGTFLSKPLIYGKYANLFWIYFLHFM